jgi:hypothetical protein
MAGCKPVSVAIVMPAQPLNEENIMEKRSEVHAVHAESLVFESSFGFADSVAINTSHEVARRAQSIPAWDAAVYSSDNPVTNGTTKSPISHQVWPGF